MPGNADSPSSSNSSYSTDHSPLPVLDGNKWWPWGRTEHGPEEGWTLFIANYSSLSLTLLVAWFLVGTLCGARPFVVLLWQHLPLDLTVSCSQDSAGGGPVAAMLSEVQLGFIQMWLLFPLRFHPLHSLLESLRSRHQLQHLFPSPVFHGSYGSISSFHSSGSPSVAVCCEVRDMRFSYHVFPLLCNIPLPCHSLCLKHSFTAENCAESAHRTWWFANQHCPRLGAWSPVHADCLLLWFLPTHVLSAPRWQAIQARTPGTATFLSVLLATMALACCSIASALCFHHGLAVSTLL